MSLVNLFGRSSAHENLQKQLFPIQNKVEEIKKIAMPLISRPSDENSSSTNDLRELRISSSFTISNDDTLKYVGKIEECNSKDFWKELSALVNSESKWNVLFINSFFFINRETLKTYIEQGITVHPKLLARVKVHQTDSELVYAAVIGSVNLIDEALNKHPVDQADNKGLTPLQAAVYYDNYDVMRLLLKRGANPNLETEKKNPPPLLCAVLRNSIEAIEILIKEGQANINQKSEYPWDYSRGFTPLSYAAKNGHINLMQTLIDLGADVNSDAIIKAARENQLNAVKLLLKHQADVNFQDEEEFTALLDAASGDHYEMCKLLIESGAKDLQTNLASSPLMNAIMKSNLQLVQLFLSHKIHREDLSPYIINATCHGDQKICEALLNAGASVDTTNTYGTNLLGIASAKNHEALVRFLIAKGATVDHLNKDGKTPYMLALESNFSKILDILTESGAKYYPQDGKSFSPLERAVRDGREDLVRILLANNADPNQPSFSETPLMIASQKNYFNICKLLIDAGALLDTPNDHKTSALHKAAAKGHFEACKVLIERGANIFAIDKDGLCAPIYLKFMRRKNYKAIKDLFVKADNDQELARLYEYTKIVKLLSHAGELSGHSIVNNQNLVKLDRTGLHGYYHFKRFSKDFDLFHPLFSNSFSKEMIAQLKEALEFEADEKNLTMAEVAKRCFDGKPTFVSTGFYGHSVQMFIWGNSFFLCNRGAKSSRKVDIFKFDKTLNDLEKLIYDLKDLKQNSEESYENFVTKTFKSPARPLSPLEKFLENFLYLENQISENCAWASLEQAFFTFMCVNKLKEEGITSNSEFNEKEVLELLRPQMDLMEDFITFQRALYLEKYLDFVTVNTKYLEIDLVKQALEHINDEQTHKKIKPFIKAVKSRAKKLINC